ncbi:MAG: hypothetical protein ACFFCP_11405 [Promethearchaeota archaeon]
MLNDKISDPRELTLCKTISAITETVLRENLDGTPLYEVGWFDVEKESSWKPALSLIPVSRRSTFRPNVHVYQQFRVRGIESPFYAHYEGFTPRNDTVIMTGIEIGAVLDVTIPGGIFFFGGKGWGSVEYFDDSFAEIDNPVYYMIKKDSENKKQSRLFQNVRGLYVSSEYKATIRLGPRGIYSLSYPATFMLIPRGKNTVVMVSTCAAPPKGFKEKLTVSEGRTVNFEFGPPSDVAFSNGINVLWELMHRAHMIQSAEEVIARSPPIGSELMMYLVLESARRLKAVQGDRLSFRDVFDPNPSDAVNELFNLLPEGQDSEEKEGRVEQNVQE